MNNKKVPIFLCLLIATLLMVSSFSSVFSSAQGLADDDTDQKYKYVILDTTDQGKVKKAGYEIVENYDSYILAKKPVGKDPLFLEKNGISVIKQQKELKKIHLKTGTITKENVETIKSKSILSSNSYYLVKSIGPIKQGWKSTIEDHGDIVDYIPENTYITKMSNQEAKKLSEKDFVSFVGNYRSSYKISPDLKESKGIRLITISTYEDSNSILTKLSSYGKILKHGEEQVTMEVDGSYIDDIAKINSIAYIEPSVSLELLNAEAQWTVQTGSADDRSIWDHGLTGDGEIVGISDTGIDYDHAAFRDPEGDPIGPNHRKIVRYVAHANDHDLDSSGHGTHTSGSIAGNDAPFGSNMNDGEAKDAKLSFYDIGGASDSLEIPSDVADIFQAAYDDGARIHSNSWGGKDSSYTSQAKDVDQFMWNHKDMLIFYANGNSGPSSNTVGTPATAKNIVSVGASGDGNQNTGKNDIADFSSRGPTDDGRMKPTIVTPGMGDQVTSRQGIESADSDGDLSTNNNGYISMPGTSMACPTAAGSATLARQYFVDGYYPRGTISDPSAALIKSVMVNGAVEISGSEAYKNSNSYPNNDQGWGRTNLENSLEFDGDDRHLKVYDETDGLTTGNSNTYSINVDDTSQPFEVTMAYTDYPGSTSASKALVNDLNLKVTAPDGSVYKGNVFSGYNPGQSATGGDYDDLDPLENVLRLNPQKGEYTIEVLGENIPQGAQPFALSVTGGITTGTPPNASFSYSPINIDVGQTVQFSYNSDDPDGSIESWSWDFGDGTTSSAQNPTHSYSSKGSYTVKLTVTDNDGLSDSDTKEMFVGNQAPGASFDISSLNPDVNQDVQFTDQSNDPDGSIESWSWDFGDGTTSSVQNPTHSYSSKGSYTIKLTVTDNEGADDSTSKEIYVGEKPNEWDFESDPSEWSTSGLWHLVDDSDTYGDSNSPTHSMWYGQDSSGDYDTGSQTTGSLTSPSIDLSGVSSAELSFSHWFETESYQDGNYDKIKVTVNGNQVYYKDSTDSNVGSEGNFVKETINLSSYTGSSIDIKFTSDSVDEKENAYRGWYVDDVGVDTSENDPPTADFSYSVSDSQSTTSTDENYQTRIMTQSDIEELKDNIGVYQPGKDYNELINGHGTGFAPPTQEEYGQLLGTTYVEDVDSTNLTLSSSVDLTETQYFPPIGDQGQQSSCASWSTAYYANTYLQAKAYGWDVSSGDSDHLMSPSWVYNKVNGGSDSGSYLSGPMKLVKTLGCADMQTMPYDDSDYTSWGDESAWRDAPQHRVEGKESTSVTNIDTVKSWIDGGTPVAMAVNGDEYNFDGDNVLSSSEYSAGNPNHANTVVGYDDSVSDDGETGAFLIANSWGASWGPSNDGTYYMTYECFKDLAASNAYHYTGAMYGSSSSPEKVVSMDLSSTGARDATVELGRGSPSSPEDTRQPEWDGGSEDFPSFMCFDVTGLEGSSSDYYTDFSSASSSSTISSFTGESYTSGYNAGNPDDSYESTDTPVSTPGTASVEFSGGNNGDSVSFTDESTDSDGTIESWSWNFGDGSSSTEQNPTHSYSSTGTYTVELTVTDNDGATDTISKDITISDNGPKANFSFSPTEPEVDETVSFIDESTDSDGTIESWSWDFGDGSTSTSQNPTHSYSSEGTYTINLTVTDNDELKDSTTKDITVNNKQSPTTSFSYSPTSPTVDESVQFTDESTDSDGSIESWSWNFGDGTTSSTQNPTHAYSSEGSYTINLTVTDNDGLKDSITKDITAYKEQSPTASFSYSPTSPTVDETVQFTDESTDSDGSIESWSWDLGDGSSSTSQNPTHSYSSEGTYTVNLTVTDNDDLEDSIIKDITVVKNQPPTASFSYSPTSPTVDETIQFTDGSSDQDGTVESWSWDFGDGSTSTSQNPTHSYSSENTYTVQLTVTDDKGKEDATSKDITVEKQSELTLGKALDNTELSWTTGGDNDWIPQTSTYYTDGDAAQSGDISDYDSTYIQTTLEGSGTLSFYWKVSSEYNYDFLTFYVDGTEQNSISGSTSWTQESYTLSSGTHTLKWSFKKDWYGSSNEDCGWLDDVQFSTATNQKPDAKFSYSPSSPSTDDTIQFTDESTDPDGTVESWSWDFGDGSTSNAQNPTHSYSSENTYTVQLTVTDDDGATDTYTEDITVDNDQFEKVIDQDFEGDVSGWQASGLWHLVDESETYGDSNSPSTSVWYGQDSTGNYATGSQTTGSLIVPTLDLSGATQAQLTFSHWFETENYDSKEFDKVKVTVNGYQVYYRDSTDSNVGSENNFIKETIDISPYIGSSVNIEFTFDSVDGSYNDYRGWYVDDVVVQADSGSIASVNSISNHDTLDTSTNDISGVMSSNIDINQPIISERLEPTSDKIATTVTTKKIL